MEKVDLHSYLLSLIQLFRDKVSNSLKKFTTKYKVVWYLKSQSSSLPTLNLAMNTQASLNRNRNKVGVLY